VTHGQVAKSVRENKERNPEHYCADKRCLWRTYNARTQTHKPCPKHPARRP